MLKVQPSVTHQWRPLDSVFELLERVLCGQVVGSFLCQA